MQNQATVLNDHLPKNSLHLNNLVIFKSFINSDSVAIDFDLLILKPL